MSINTIPAQDIVDPARAILRVGSQVLDFTEWECEHSGIMEAGTFRAEITAPPASWPWWAQQTEIVVDLFAGTPRDPAAYSADDLVPLMAVRCDMIELRPEFQQVSLRGRDLTSLLIDNKTTEKWPNLTSSEIAQQIAAKWGLQANIQATSTIVGRYYTQDHVVLAKADTYWNILTYLAQREAGSTPGFSVFVIGRTLYFGAFGAAASREPYLIQFNGTGQVATANAMGITLARDLTLAQDISVTVRSYHGYRGAAFKATATATKTAKRMQRDAQLAQALQQYDYTIPGLTQPECALRAQELLKQLSGHELRMSARLPFDALLFPWVPVQLAGTGTPWDTTYAAQSVRRRMAKGRISMGVEARAGVPQQTVTLE